MQYCKKPVSHAIHTCVYTGLLVAGMSAPQLHAEEGLELEEIVVTARKREESLQEVPMAVSAFGAAKIDQYGMKSIDDVARFTPGLSFSNAFGRSTERPVIRGLSNVLAGVRFGVESGAAYFVDGMYYSGDLQSLDIDDLQRVEIIKGPQSALYGRNTYSGAINFVTNGAPEEFGGKISTTFGEEGERNLNFSLGGPLSDTVRGALKLRSYNFDGEWENQVTEKTVGDESTDSISGVIEWDFSESTTISARMQYQKDDDGTRAFFLQPSIENNCYPRESDGTMLYYCGEITARPIALNDEPDADGIPNLVDGVGPVQWGFIDVYGLGDGLAFSGVERELLYSSLSVEHDLDSGGTFKAGVTWHDEDVKTGSDSDHSSANPTHTLWGTFVQVNQEAYPFADSSESQREDVSFEMAYDSDPKQDLRWRAGVFYYKREQTTLDISFVEEIDGYKLDESELENRAVFGSVEYDVNDKLTVSVEARYSEEDKNTTEFNRADAFGDNTLGAYDGLPRYEGDGSFYVFAPRFTASYQYSENINLYANVAQGDKPGGLNGQLGLNTGKPTYAPEESIAYEMGIKSILMDGRLMANLSVYFTDITDIQGTQPAPGTTGTSTSIVVNSGDGEVLGLELELAAKVTENLDLGVTYALADSEYTKGCDDFQWNITSGGGSFDPANPNGNGSNDPNGQGSCSLKGQQFAFSPKHTASVTLDYSRVMANGIEFVGGIDATYESKKYVQVHNEAFVGAYTLVGARLGFEGENWKAMLVGRNLTNADEPILATRWLETDFSRAFFGNPRRERHWAVEFDYSF
jgi:outer membrane receptor protein involved in Fe transport